MGKYLSDLNHHSAESDYRKVSGKVYSKVSLHISAMYQEFIQSSAQLNNFYFIIYYCKKVFVVQTAFAIFAR